jgi:NADH-quinone oxidoreductase subunit L
MVTHAFFKALLFLGSGSVIHGLHDEQDMRHMGALRKFMPVTAATFIVGWLAIAGVPPFAGFWSKDEILLFAWDSNPALWAVGLVTALLTAYYMSRQVFMVFYGEAHFDEEHVHPHEAPWTMKIPLIVLAGLAAVGGALNLPFDAKTKLLEDWLHPVVGAFEADVGVSSTGKIALAAVATVASLVGLAAAVVVYLQHRVKAVEPDLLLEAYHYDETLARVVGDGGLAAAEAVARVADQAGIDGAVNGLAGLVRQGGERLRVVQTGFVRNYALGIAGGAVLTLGWFLIRAGI